MTPVHYMLTKGTTQFAELNNFVFSSPFFQDCIERAGLPFQLHLIGLLILNVFEDELISLIDIEPCFLTLLIC